MPSSRLLTVCCSLTLVALAFSTVSNAVPPVTDTPALADTENEKVYATLEAAASDMVRAIATKSHKLFLQARLLGVCEGQNDWPSRYAECLHTMKFSTDEGEFTTYDMPRRLMPDTIRVVSTTEMDVPHGLLKSSFYGQKFVNVDLVIANYDGLEYRTRIVVAKNADRWNAIPRRRRCGFYSIADVLPSGTKNVLGEEPSSPPPLFSQWAGDWEVSNKMHALLGLQEASPASDLPPPSSFTLTIDSKPSQDAIAHKAVLAKSGPGHTLSTSGKWVADPNEMGFNGTDCIITKQDGTTFLWLTHVPFTVLYGGKVSYIEGADRTRDLLVINYNTNPGHLTGRTRGNETVVYRRKR